MAKKNFLFSSVIDRLKEVENIDLVCCLNVLDRCADPYEILSEIHRTLSPNGRAIIALVLPYSHYVETSKLQNRALNKFDILINIFFAIFAHFPNRHVTLTNKTIATTLVRCDIITI